MTAGTRRSPLLAIDELHSRFIGPDGMVRAVDGVSLAVPAGSRLGVVGESGSGKTQTFFGILGLSAGSPGVVQGRATFNDIDLLGGLDRFVRPGRSDVDVEKDMTGWVRHQRSTLQSILGRDIAILFQDPKRSLIPYWTIRQHLLDVLKRRGVAEGRENRAGELLALLGFRNPRRILESFPEQLSGGEAQRSLLAITLAMQPQLLVADEPTTGLDTINQVRVLDALLHVQEAATLALVLISHDLAVVDAMVDDVVVLFAGRVMERASAEWMRTAGDDELHPYTRQLRDSQRRRSVGQALPRAAHQQRLSRAPTGCPYHARCALRPQLPAALQSRCASEVPPEAIVAPGHTVACWGITP